MEGTGTSTERGGDRERSVDIEVSEGGVRIFYEPRREREKKVNFLVNFTPPSSLIPASPSTKLHSLPRTSDISPLHDFPIVSDFYTSSQPWI